MSQTSIEIVKDLHEVLQQRDDVNSWVRRFFRCWIGGDYQGFYPCKDGHEQYLKNVSEYRRRHMLGRTAVITLTRMEFCAFITCEYGQKYDIISNTTIWKYIQECLGDKEAVDKYLEVFAEDALDLLTEGELQLPAIEPKWFKYTIKTPRNKKLLVEAHAALKQVITEVGATYYLRTQEALICGEIHLMPASIILELGENTRLNVVTDILSELLPAGILLPSWS